MHRSKAERRRHGGHRGDGELDGCHRAARQATSQGRHAQGDCVALVGLEGVGREGERGQRGLSRRNDARQGRVGGAGAAPREAEKARGVRVGGSRPVEGDHRIHLATATAPRNRGHERRGGQNHLCECDDAACGDDARGHGAPTGAWPTLRCEEKAPAEGALGDGCTTPSSSSGSRQAPRRAPRGAAHRELDPDGVGLLQLRGQGRDGSWFAERLTEAWRCWAWMRTQRPARRPIDT